ncbi:unnamed protein product [Oppiella nova]|uniref:FAS1 domain-containing protein n=1 Tax=Oppiella nova TaxID=334625 RepID=A0A7R9LBE9_9ACAR|nr:unnamed protein product [Oppiella nova]CAG2161791.1 unnamed protein product [Oppiella nova]
MCSLMRTADQQELNQLLGPNFTILAPSDEAFGLIPGSQIEELKNKQKQKEFIAQHIIPSRLSLSSFRAFDERELKNANGLTHHITAYPNGFVINGANVIDGDIQLPRSNNLIQVVDKVLYPQKDYNLLQVLEENPHLTQISSFLALSGLQKELTTNDSFTFFAPNDEAFRAVPWPVTQQMLSNNTFLRLLIANHMIPGKQYATGLAGSKVHSIGGNVLNFTSRTVQSHTLVLVNLVPILDSDLIANNGVIHVITRIILPKELMDDCQCLSNSTTKKADNSTTAGNDTSTLDPLIEKMLSSDQNLNNIDRRYGLAPPRNTHQNGDHFTSTPKPVSFKSFWDDIFATTDDTLNATQSASTTPANGTQTTPNTRNTTTPAQTNVTELPFIWDFLTTETPQAINESTNGNTSRVASMSRLRHFTAGVQYDDDLNTTTTANGTTASDTASTGQPNQWTRPFYRPERRRNTTETTAQNTTNQVETTTPLSIGNSFFRPTLKPVFRPTNRRETFTGQPNTENTVPPYDRRYGIQRDQKPANGSDDQFARRQSRVNEKIQEPIEQLKDDDQYIEQEIEPQSKYNRSQYPYQRDSKQTGPQYQDNASQPGVRRPHDLRRNDSRYAPEEVEQKPYSPTSWTHQQNISHTPAQTYPRQPARQQLNWWDSRYEPEVYSMAGYAPPSPQQQPSPQTRDQDPRSPFQSAQTRADRQRNYRPGVVYVDQSVPQFYRPPVKDGSGRPYYRPPNDTKSGSYPQSSRAGAPRAQRPSSDVYSRPEYIDRSYVPSYDPYGRPTMVVGEYPYTHMDQPYSPMDQFRPRDPYQRPQRFDPFDRRRPGSDTKTSSSTYDSIRRRGDQRSGRPDEEKPQSKPDLKTISEIIESPDLMVGGKFKTFNTLKELITDSGLWEALNRPTTFITIFMPTDDAFAAITDGSVEEMKRNPKLVNPGSGRR